MMLNRLTRSAVAGQAAGLAAYTLTAELAEALYRGGLLSKGDAKALVERCRARLAGLMDDTATQSFDTAEACSDAAELLRDFAVSNQPSRRRRLRVPTEADEGEPFESADDPEGESLVGHHASEAAE